MLILYSRDLREKSGPMEAITARSGHWQLCLSIKRYIKTTKFIHLEKVLSAAAISTIALTGRQHS